MQDSIEDYIRITRNCKEGPTPAKKEILITAQFKKECDAKAMQILQFALEGKMRSDALFRCLPYINQSHYQDIVEERALSKLCGYPLCSKRIPDMPKKQFFISTKNNKVYDITDRKNYCSNFCYRASIHVKSQIDTSPLWLRKPNEKAHFTLLNKSEKGLPGEVVDQGITKPVSESFFTSVSDFTKISLDEAEELELKPEEEEQTKKQLRKPKKYQKTTMKTINENEEDLHTEVEPILEKQHIKLEPSFGKNNPIQRESCNKESDSIKECTPKVKEKKIIHKLTEPDVEAHLCKCFKEWFSLETFTFIYGEEIIKEKLNEQKLSNYFESLNIAELQIEQQKRYIDICRKLHLKELADEKFDNAVVGNKQLKPIPDYQQLKEESKELDLKVKSFYSGDLLIEENKKFLTKNIEESNIEEEGPPAILPLVEVTSQNALRRKIFLNYLNKTIQVLFQTLKINPSLVLSELQSLVKTFKFKADNIIFKPPVWNFIAIILIRIVSLKDDNLKELLESEHCKTHIDLWLSPLPNKEKLINDILKILENIDFFVESYITCK